MAWPRTLAPASLLALLVGNHALAATPPGERLTKILVDSEGIVRVSERALREAGASFEKSDLERLRLTLKGQEVPLRIAKLPGGDPEGRFAFEFVGHAPRGTKTWDNEYNTRSTYILELAPKGARPARFRPQKAPGVAASLAHRRSSRLMRHHERNTLLIRFTTEAPPDESWFWRQVKASDSGPTAVPVKAESVDGEAGATLRVRFVGYSHLSEDPDHTVQVDWNGESLGKAVWDGENPLVFEAELSPGRLKEGDNTLSLRATGETTGGIDLVLLDWVEVGYSRLHRFGDSPQIEVAGDAAAAARLEAKEGEPLLVFDEATRDVFEVPVRGGGADLPPRAGVLLAVRRGGGQPPAAVVVGRPADLRAPGLGADFVIIAHETLLPAAARLAAARREEGLRSEVVNVADVYDRFNGGFLDPEAIRAFLKFAYQSWTPRPRYVLLFGDASWDYKNTFVRDSDYADWHWSEMWPTDVPKNTSSPYPDWSGVNNRLLVPTYQYQSPWGHAASDHIFSCVDGDDDVADLAVGRIPAGSLDEANAAVDKILAYGQRPEQIQSALFITNDDKGFQAQTDNLVTAAEGEGYTPMKIYPKAEEKDNVENTAEIRKAFDAGQALVVFTGHGGRYIWRTGPPDYRKNHDLFTMKDLDALEETQALPVVVSLTCYSAPFDHPVADSIGEKLLRVPGRGAVAVVASSWRNVPPMELAQQMMRALASEPRIGDAFRKAMETVHDRVSVFTYNLLGDPTTRYRGPHAPAPATQAAGQQP